MDIVWNVSGSEFGANDGIAVDADNGEDDAEAAVTRVT